MRRTILRAMLAISDWLNKTAWKFGLYMQNKKAKCPKCHIKMTAIIHSECSICATKDFYDNEALDCSGCGKQENDCTCEDYIGD